jgi:hypothetical protein
VLEPREPFVRPIEPEFDGKPFYAWHDEITRLRRAGEIGEAQRVLVGVVAALEAENERSGSRLSPWYYEQLAILYHGQERPADELRVLESYERREKPPQSIVIGRRLAKLRGVPFESPPPPPHEETRTFLLSVHGVSFANADGTARQAIIRRCNVGDAMRLIPEPENPHDPFAVKVCRGDGAQVGYLPLDHGLTGPVEDGKVTATIAFINAVPGTELLAVVLRITRPN